MTPPWIAAATQRTANVATCMRSAPTAAGTSGGTSAKRTATGIAPKRAAETSARRDGVQLQPPRRHEAAEHGRRRRLGQDDAGQHHGTPRPAEPAEPLREQQHAEERGERGLEREDERGPRRRRARLHPGRDEVAQGAREDARDDERIPRPRVGGPLRLPGDEGDHGESGEGDRHLEERQGTRVVPRREPLHRDDLEGLGDGVPEHERVAHPRAAGRSAQQEKPGEREHDADPDRRGNRGAKGHERDDRREDDVEARDEAGARDGRQLEARGLEAVGSGE